MRASHLARLFIIGFLTTLSACAASQSTTTAITPVGSAQATTILIPSAIAQPSPQLRATTPATSTLVPVIVTPLSREALLHPNLTSRLLQSGDLPDNITATEVRDLSGDALYFPSGINDAKPLRQIDQAFERQGHPVGDVAIWLYSTADDAVKHFDLLVPAARQTHDIGERAMIDDQLRLNGQVTLTKIDFQRCHAVIGLQLLGPTRDEAVAYAQRLDQRLVAAICPQG